MNTTTTPVDPPAAAAVGPGAPAGLTIRAARAQDETRVARLLSLRGTDVQDCLAQAPAMIASMPVLLLATLAPQGQDEAGDAAGRADDGADLAAPVALSGAFVLPAESGEEPGWMVSGLVVDPQLRRGGIGRALLAAVVQEVGRQAPGARLRSVVEAGNHASLAVHMAVGFRQLERVESFAGVGFPEGGAVVLGLTCPTR